MEQLTSAVIEIDDLTFRYPLAERPALANVDLSVNPGEMVCIVGANGAGKSTLCSAVRGLVPHFTKGDLNGSVRVLGRSVPDTALSELARDVGYVFQNPFTQMSGVSRTVFEELAYGLGNLGVPPDEMRDRVERMLDRTDLQPLRDRNPFQLSGGQQQRVALASILVMQQPVLVIDEPTSQLDPESTDMVFELVAAARDEGRTVLLVEHKMEHIAKLADRIVVLSQGGVLLDGPPAAVFSDPRCEAAGTRMPESMYLSRALVDRGLNLPAHPLTVEKLIADVEGTGVQPTGETNAAFRPSTTKEIEHPILKLQDVSFSYPNGVEAVQGLSVALARGESLGIIGQNGAGKTTTAKLMNGLLKPSSGRVLVGGDDTRDWTAAQTARRIGYVFQNPDDQIFNATVFREVEYALKRTDLSESARRERVDQALELTGLTGEHDTNPYDLPPSVRKFVTIASAIANDTDVMILDEPTAGQDLVGLNRLMQLLRTLQKKGKSVITITHDMEFVSQNFTRTVVMANRQLLRDTATNQVFYDTDALQTAHVDQPAFVQVADHFGGPEIGLSMNRLVHLLRPARPDETDDQHHSDHEEPSDD